MTPEGAYAVLVRGDSMIGDGIHDGDFVIVDPGRVPEDGDIAVVRLSNWRHPKTQEPLHDRLVKRLRNGGTVLESSNRKYQPIVLRPENSAVIEGQVIAVVGLPLAVQGPASPAPGPGRRGSVSDECQ
jgi:SOS-response transcriptional repressor LexA